ncbi:MAG: hypothetical protein JXO72_08455 [Vicinamibacteria bacterium]|nr:hypothetical protein [Vicinamibacteria bacterium]
MFDAHQGDPIGELTSPIRKLQIQIGFLLAGWLISALLVLAAVQISPARSTRQFVWTYAGAVVAAGGLLARRFVDRMLVESRMRSTTPARSDENQSGASEEVRDHARMSEARRLLFVMRQWLVVRTAVLEAASLLPLVAYFIERSPISLALAVLMVGPAVAQFPTTSATRWWIGRRMRASDERPAPSLLGS